MNIPSRFSELFDKLNCCVIVPTYNNAASLGEVLKGVLALTQDVIVVNDGSTDDTATILEGFNIPHLIQYPINQGKG